jgi:hypothetical protein
VPSPTGATIAIVRQDGPHPQGELGDDSLWIEPAAAGEATCVLGRACGRGDSAARSIGRPTFSPDGRHLYFTTATYVHASRDLVRFDIGSRRLLPMGEAASVAIVRNGPYEGFLVVSRHTSTGDGSHFYYPSFLLDPDGRLMRRLPDDPEAAGDPMDGGRLGAAPAQKGSR